MTLVTRSALASIDASTAMFAPQIPDLIAGEAIDVCAPCYIKTSDGAVWMCNGTSANEAAEVVGFSARAAAVGQKVTLFGKGARFKYSDGLLTAGNYYYIAGTAGRLDDAATTGDAFGVAQAINTNDIRIVCDIKPWTSATIGAGTIDATALAADAVTTAKILNANVTTAKIADVSVTQAKIEVGTAGAGLTGLVTKFVASGNVIGGIPVVHHVLVAAGTNGDTDITLTHKTRIAFVVVHPRTSVASATLQVKNVTNVMSDAIVAAVAGVITTCGSLAVAYDTIAAGTVLRVTGAGGATQPDADVYVFGFRVA